MEKFTIANKVAFRYSDCGTGEKTIMLLHGYLESLEVWEQFGGELSKTHRVIALDLPGHGISQVVGEVHTMGFLADTVYALLEQVGVKRCFVAGHSMGGYVALEFAKRYPETLQGLILLHSVPNGDTPERVENRKREIALVEAGKRDALVTVNPESRFAPENRKKMADKIEELIEMATLTEEEGILAILRGIMAREDYSEQMPKWSMPKLLVFGTHDGIIPIESARDIADKNPTADVVWLEHSGHMGFVEEPSETLAAVESFLA